MEEPQRSLVTVEENTLPIAEQYVEEYVRLQAEVEKKRAESDAMLDAARVKIETWRDAEIARLQRQMDEIEPFLASLITNLTVGTKKRSINVPSGTAGFRRQAPVLTFGGERVNASNKYFLTAIARQGLTQYIKQKPVLDWEALKSTLKIMPDGTVSTADGEVIEGLTATILPDKFYVRGRTAE